MHETRTNLQRKAANAARAKSERRLVADELKDDASSDDDAHGADSAPCEYNARRRPQSATAARRANDSAAQDGKNTNNIHCAATAGCPEHSLSTAPV